MTRPLLYSGALHAVLFVLLIIVMHPSAQKTKAVYTIDFIGNASQPMRFGEPEAAPAPPAPAQEPEIKQPEPAPAAPKESEIKTKAAKLKYNSDEQISAKAKKNQKNKQKEEAKKEEPKKEEKVVLSKPSILGEVDSQNIAPGTLQNINADSGAKAVRASFNNFPYPWYITTVRNALWQEWSKRMPKNTDLRALVSFNIDKYGAVYGVVVEESSGNDAYDYAATSAVTNAKAYPPLPTDFNKDILTVTVEFKNED